MTHLTALEIATLVDDLCGDDERGRLLDHVDQCPDCSQWYLESLTPVDDSSEAASTSEPHEQMILLRRRDFLPEFEHVDREVPLAAAPINTQVGEDLVFSSSAGDHFVHCVDNPERGGIDVQLVTDLPRVPVGTKLKFCRSLYLLKLDVEGKAMLLQARHDELLNEVLILCWPRA